jgi:hypothetical protein
MRMPHQFSKKDAIGAIGISFYYIFNHVYLTFRTYCIVVFHNVSIYDRFWLSGLRPLVLLLPKLIRLSNISILSVHDEGYSRNASCILSLISTFLLINYIHKLFCMQTSTSCLSFQWRLFEMYQFSLVLRFRLNSRINKHN